jgi:DNA-binding transcriptional LysR family regulator
VISTAGATPGGGLAVPLFRWRRVVAVPRTHPLAALDRAPTLQELAALPLLSYDSSQRPESSLRRAFAAQGLEPQLAMTAHEGDLLKTYVRAGLGVAILAEMAVSAIDDPGAAARARPARLRRAPAAGTRSAARPPRPAARHRRPRESPLAAAADLGGAQPDHHQLSVAAVPGAVRNASRSARLTGPY